MKKTLFYIFIFLQVQLSHAQYGTIHPNDTMYVFAPNGLNIRTAPCSSGEVIGKMEHFKAVIVKSISDIWIGLIDELGHGLKLSKLVILLNRDLSFLVF